MAHPVQLNRITGQQRQWARNRSGLAWTLALVRAARALGYTSPADVPAHAQDLAKQTARSLHPGILQHLNHELVGAPGGRPTAPPTPAS